MLRGVKKPHLKGWRATQGGIYRLKKFICVCFALVARLQVHADNGCLRSHQVAQVDRSNRLNDSRLPKQATAAHFKLVDNAQARIRRYLGYIFSSLLGPERPDVPPDHGCAGETVSPSPHPNSQTSAGISSL